MSDRDAKIQTQLQGLRSDEAVVRERAVHELVLLDAKDQVETISTLLQDPEPAVRSETLRALMHLRGDRSASLIAKALGDEVTDVRDAAVRALGNLRSDESRKALATALRDPVVDIRRTALWSLRNAEGLGREVAVLLQDPERSLRIAALRKLGQIKSGECAPEIQALLDDPDREIAKLAAQTLKAVGGSTAGSNTQPAWLRHNPWKALAAETFELSDPWERHSLKVESAGSISVPSGELVATSFVMDLEAAGTCGGYFKIPAGEYRAFLTLDQYERKSLSGKPITGQEAAYLTLILSKTPEVRREILFRKSEEGTREDGIFFIDKYVFALADRLELEKAFGRDNQRLQSWIDERLDSVEPGMAIQSLDFPGGKGHLHCLRAPNGIAAAVAGVDRAGNIVALHFPFFVIGSTGEDGEFEGK